MRASPSSTAAIRRGGGCRGAAADVAIVFATQWSGESIDVPMTLDGNQDALIDAVAAANPRTAVVLETNAGVAMPWAARVPAIVEAWYPGRAGGKAIANVLTGRVNPSGHLPVTFSAQRSAAAAPGSPGRQDREGRCSLCHYSEGAAVGYKWFDAQQPAAAVPVRPRPFLHALPLWPAIAPAPSPTAAVTVQFTVRNVGQRAGWRSHRSMRRRRTAAGKRPKRLVGFPKVDLAPGASRTVASTSTRGCSRRSTRRRSVADRARQPITCTLGESVARHPRGRTTVTLPGLTLPSNWRPGPAAAAPAPQRGERGR